MLAFNLCRGTRHQLFRSSERNGGKWTRQERSNILEHELWDVGARYVSLKKVTGNAEMRRIEIGKERN